MNTDTTLSLDKKGLLHIPVHNHGYVQYVDHLGSDQRIVEAARVSYKSPSKGKEADDKLLHYLYKQRHSSPFEQCNITFNIKMPIFVMRQFVRHRTFRLNEWSGRYSELADEFYIPTVWRAQDTKNKQGSAGELKGLDDQEVCNVLVAGHNRDCYETYQSLLSKGVAKELARIVLPLSVYTEIYVNCDLHNLMHFLRLRLDAHAQSEIQDYAKAMHAIAKELFPVTFEAFDRYKVQIIDQKDVDEMADTLRYGKL